MRPEYMVALPLAVLLIGMLYLVFKRGGFRGVMFGARIAKRVGVLELGRRGIFWRTLRVYRLQPQSEASAQVGLEVWTSSMGYPEMHLVPLTSAEALSLSTLLEQAAREAPPEL